MKISRQGQSNEIGGDELDSLNPINKKKRSILCHLGDGAGFQRQFTSTHFTVMERVQ
jgi:hypothetical protein